MGNSSSPFGLRRGSSTFVDEKKLQQCDVFEPLLLTVGTALKDQTSLIPKMGKACLSSKEMRFPFDRSRSKYINTIAVIYIKNPLKNYQRVKFSLD